MTFNTSIWGSGRVSSSKHGKTVCGVSVAVSLDFVLLEVGDNYLLDVLVVLHDHHLPVSITNEDAGGVVLEGGGAKFARDGAHREAQKAGQGYDVEVARLVALELVI